MWNLEEGSMEVRRTSLKVISPTGYQNRKTQSVLTRALSDESGQVLPWVVLLMGLFLGMSALVVDIGHAMLVQRELQASADAAALAAVRSLPSSTYKSVAWTYSAGKGGKNAYNAISIGRPQLLPLCVTSVSGLPACTATNPNALQVTETATIRTFFAGVLGHPTMTLSATSTAAKTAQTVPLNVAILVDSTLSMNIVDPACGGATQEQCALNGVQQLLQGLAPSVDHVSLFTFPAVQAGSSAGVVSSSGNFTCTTNIPSSYGSSNYPSNPSFGNYTMLWEGGSYEQPYPGVATAMPYTFPPIPTNTSGYTVASGANAPTYQVAGFSNNYLESGTTKATLNTNSGLVQAAGSKSGCGGLAPSNYDGDYGTYYAGAIYAAQAALLAEQVNNPGSQNIMIILGDGNSDAPNAANSPDSKSPSMPSTATQATTTYGSSSSLNSSAYTLPSGYLLASDSGTYPSWVGECNQAVAAAQYASTYSNSANPTRVYTIAYGSSTSSAAPTQGNNGYCATDITASVKYPNISPCMTMQLMSTGATTTSAPYFYSDTSGGSSDCVPIAGPGVGIGDLDSIFRSITNGLVGVRLIPNGSN